LLQVHEGGVLVPFLGQKVEGVDLFVAVEVAPDLPCHALLQHAFPHAEAVEDLQRPLRPADRAGADGNHVVVVEHDRFHAPLREVDRHGQANGPCADDGDGRVRGPAVKLGRRMKGCSA
jgi:uncharacterized linocin/CFP29 family protein